MTTFIHERMKFFFVHVPKTGGMTVTGFFAQGVRREWRNNFSTLNEGIGIHDGVEKIYEKLGPLIDEYYSFAFYRNTWDWMFSLYRYIKKTKKHPRHQETAPLNFDEFVRIIAPSFYRPQMPLVTKDRMQAVIQLEDFRDFPVAFPKILTDLGYDKIKFHSYNKSEYQVDYKSAYNKDTMKMVGDIYEEDIEYFGFRF